MRILFWLFVLTSTVLAQPKGADITFNTDNHDFGIIEEAKGKVTYRFDFKNKGTAPLVINDVESSCGCTTPEWPRKPILPGESGYILAIYDPKNRPGKFEKTITISSNAAGEKATYILTITGNVIPPDNKYN